MKRNYIFWAVIIALLMLPAAALAQSPELMTSGPTGRIVFQQASDGPILTVNLDGTDLRMVGVGMDPSWSPDGTQIVYSRWATPWGLYTVNADGTNEQRILDLQTTRSPRFSPDGQGIAFVQRDWSQPEREVCRTFSGPGFSKTFCYDAAPDDKWWLKVFYSSENRLDQLPAWPHSRTPVWHPDNNHIYYGNEKGIHQMDRQGTLAYDSHLPYRNAISLDTNDTDPAISPDGRFLATTYYQHDHWEIHRIDLHTGARQRLTTSSILDEREDNNVSPTWSPDGQNIIFLSDRDGGEGVWGFYIMNANGTNQHPVLQNVTAQAPIRYDYQGEQVMDWAP